MTHHTIFWNVPYTFSGKEKDVETGYGYFGARYYDSGLSIWLSVDPMSDKYPTLSPYNYCANNPVILVDPNGMEIDDSDGGPDDPMGHGNGPAKNQTNPTTQWHSPGMDNVNKMSYGNTASQSNNKPKKTNNPVVGSTNSVTNVKTIDECSFSRLSIYETTTNGNAGNVNVDKNITFIDGQESNTSMELQVRYSEYAGVTTSFNSVGAFMGPITANAEFNGSDISISIGYNRNSKTNGVKYDIKPDGTTMLFMMIVPSIISVPAASSAASSVPEEVVPAYIFIK